MGSTFVPPRLDQWEPAKPALPDGRGSVSASGFVPPAPDSWEPTKKQTLPDGRGSDMGAPVRLSDQLPAPDDVVRQATVAARAIVDVATRPGPARVPSLPVPWELSLQQPNPNAHGPGWITGKDQTDIPQQILDMTAGGIGKLAQGVEQMAEPGGRQKAGGLHQVISGGFEAATPAMVAGGIAAPLKTAVVVGAAMAAQKGTEVGLKYLGLPREYSEVAGDLVGLVAAAVAHGKLSRPAIRDTIEPVLKERAAKKAAAPAEQQYTSTGEPVGGGFTPPRPDQWEPKGESTNAETKGKQAGTPGQPVTGAGAEQPGSAVGQADVAAQASGAEGQVGGGVPGDELYGRAVAEAREMTSAIPGGLVRKLGISNAQAVQLIARMKADKVLDQSGRPLDEGGNLIFRYQTRTGAGSIQTPEFGPDGKPLRAATAPSGSPGEPAKGTPYDTPEIVAARARAAAIPRTNLIKTPERQALRSDAESQVYKPEGVEKGRQAYLFIGNPGSGKSTLAERLATETHSLVVDSDPIKKLLPEYGNGEGAGAVHDESSDIADKVLGRARAEGLNIVHPILGRNIEKVRGLRDELQADGYDVHLVHVDLPIEKAAGRVVTRFQEGGPFVDPAFVTNEIKGSAKANYDTLESEGGFKSYAEFSNDVPRGADPRFVGGRGFEALPGLQSVRRGSRPDSGVPAQRAPGAGSSQAEGPAGSGTPAGNPAAAPMDGGAVGAVDAGAVGERGAVQADAGAGPRRVPGENTDIPTPGNTGDIHARYEVRELADVQPSHNGQTFSANPKYGHRNERDYSKPENQQRVIENSSEERFNPRYHITDNPDATNGPIVVDEAGNALGGNSRAMMLQRVYGRDAAGAAAYRGLLEKRAGQFGIDPEAVRGMKQPVLVRVVSNAELASVPDGAAGIIRRTNISGTAALSASERAAADARQLHPDLVQHIADSIEAAGPSATLNDALTGKSGTAIVNRLIAEGFFSEQERPALMDGKTGAVTQLAKDRIGKALVGQFFRDSDQIARTPAAIRGKLERVAAPLAKVQGNADWDLTPAIREAVDLVEYASAHGIKNLGDVVAQQSMFGDTPWKSDAVTLAGWLRDAKPNDLVPAVRGYVGDREPTMFGETTPEAAFRQHFGGEKAARGGGSPGGPVGGAPVAGPGGQVAGGQPVAEDVPPPPPAPGPVTQFLKEETGTSLVGAILKADAKEALALKAKRDAALGEMEKAKATPGQQKFGEKTIQYFTGERDLWGARVNQVIGRLRKLVPDPVEQEALSLMRDFKGKRAELVQFLEGTHPAFNELDSNTPLMRGGPGSEYATAMERIQQLRPAILKALDPTPRMLEADEVLSTIAAGTLKEGQRLGILESRWTPEQYNPHILHPKGEGELPTQPAGDRMGKAIGGKMGRYFAFAETREFPTLLDAVVNNYRPKTLNAFDAFTIHGDKFATARATHLLTTQLADSGMGKWGVRERAPEGWEPLAAHSTEFRNLVGYTDQEGLPAAAEQRLFVPRFISDALRPITDPDYMGRIPLFRGMRMTQAYQKTVQLGLSFFHAYTENLMSLANSGPVGWAKALRADRDSPEFLRSERDMIAHGGTSAIQGRTYEAYRALEPGSIPTWSDIWRRAPVVHQMDQVAGKITDFTFGNLQRRFKVTDYELHAAGWLAKHPEATAAETAAAKHSITKELNAVYGGLNAENLGVSRASTEVARALMLAPDWTFSNVFNVKYALERGTPAGSMARMFWLRTTVGGLAATQAMSLMLSGRTSKNPTQVYFGRDRDGNEIYQNVFFKGAGGDAINLIHNVGDYGAVEGLARSLAGKAAPIPRAALQVATNRDYLGRPMVPQGMNPIAGTVRGAVKTGAALLPVPFTVSNLHDMLLGPEAGKYSVPEFLTTTFSGNPPRHMPPEGMRHGRNGEMVEKPYREPRGIWDQMVSGRP